MNVRDDWFHGIHAHSLPTAFTPGKETHAENDGAPLPKLPNESRVLTLASPAELAKLDLYGTLHEKHTRLTVGQLRAMYADVRERTARALSGLSPEAMRATPEPSLNPLDWGLGHVAHFYEFMVLKLLSPDDPPVLPGHDVHALFDSFRAAHDDRWKPRDVVGGTTERAEVGSRETGGGCLARVVGFLNRSNHFWERRRRFAREVTDVWDESRSRRAGLRVVAAAGDVRPRAAARVPRRLRRPKP